MIQVDKVGVSSKLEPQYGIIPYAVLEPIKKHGGVSDFISYEPAFKECFGSEMIID